MGDEHKDNGRFEKETQSGFVKVIVDAFDGFVKTFKTNGLGSVSFILVLFMIFYSFILNPLNINDIVQKALAREDKIRIENQSKSIEQRLEADKMINRLMTELIDDFDINRILILETHNGSNNLAGVEFLYYSAINEMISTNSKQGTDIYDIEYQADNFQKQHIANFVGQETYQRLKHSKYLYFSDLENYHRTNYRLIHKMYSIGAESLMIIPFVSHNIPQVLMLISSREKQMPVDKIYDYVERYRSQIESDLMNIK